MSVRYIDINADLGEGSGNDAEIMPFISSCNIACGGHAGTEKSMRQTIRLAHKHGTKVGAHPSFPDRDNFGRKVMSLTKSELSEAVLRQLQDFLAVCESENEPLHHIKLHGALYNYTAQDGAASDAVVEAILATGIRPKLYVLHNSVLHRKAENLLPLEFEAFIDRRYTDDARLLSRSEPSAIIDSPESAWKQLQMMIEDQVVESVSGKYVPIKANTYCIHGDHANSVAILTFIISRLKKHNIQLK